MKKSLLALAVAAALPAVAQAQSSVTLYGIADVAVEYINARAANPTNATPGGTSGMRLIGDGQSSWNQSRFGVRGTEPLGNTGMSALFGIETRISIDNGVAAGMASTAPATNQFWNGLAFAGLKGSFGELTAGRQYTPGFYAWIHNDFTGNAGPSNWAVIGHASVAAAGSVALGQGGTNVSYGQVRADNSVMLNNTIGALNYRLMYSFGEGKLADRAASSGDLLGLSAVYSLNKQLSVSGFYHKQEALAASTTLMDNSYGVAVKYDAGTMGLSVGYSQLERVAAATGARDADTIAVSAYVNAAGGKVFLNGQQVTAKFAGAADLAITHVGLTYVRPLSNRTSVYLATNYSDQGDLGRGTQQRVSLGVNHRF